jgi:hypothetical protein
MSATGPLLVHYWSATGPLLVRYWSTTGQAEVRGNTSTFLHGNLCAVCVLHKKHFLLGHHVLFPISCAMSNARRFVRIDWWKESIRQTYESVCDTPTKKLAGNIVVGVGVGAAAAYLSYRLYRCIRGAPKPDMITLRNPDATIKLKMVGKTKVTGDTRRLRFALPSPHHTIGVPVGNHLFVSAAINGQNEIRSYTPVSGKLNERGTCLEKFGRISCNVT